MVVAGTSPRPIRNSWGNSSRSSRQRINATVPTPKEWTPDSDKVKQIVGLVGGNAEDVPGVLALYDFPTLEQQASCAWLGCGSDGGAARALKFTSEFLEEQDKIETVQDDYSEFVTPQYVEAAMSMQ